MRLTAQRVRSADGHQGINAFCYLHGPRTWLDRPPPEVAESVGHLVNRRIQIPPGGNAVLSHLDIVAPDDTSSRMIATAIVDASDLLSNRSLPLELQSADVSFEFNAGFPFAGAWRRELLMLVRAALATRIPEGFDPNELDSDEPF